MTFSINTLFVFDLDDTLYPEIDFESSGIEFVSNKIDLPFSLVKTLLKDRKNWIQRIININNSLTSEYLLNLYRNHFPRILMYEDAKLFVDKLLNNKIEMAIITDGRSITQRNKLKSLGIETYFKNIIISEEVKSEKPSELNFKMVMNKNNFKEYVYIADNTNKDFITPNKLGWTTICLLDRGHNIHTQNFNLSKEYLPQYVVKSFDEIIFNHEI